MDKVKCRFCKLEISKDNAYQPAAGMYYCNKEHYYKQLDKEKYKAKKVKSNGEPNERRELTDLIQEYYIEQGIEKHTINWSVETARIKNILDEHKDWKISGLIYTLRFMHDIEQVDLFSEQANCVMALVPFYYTKAIEWYNKMCIIEESIEQFCPTNNTIIVTKTHKKKNNKEIDISKLC